MSHCIWILCPPSSDRLPAGWSCDAAVPWTRRGRDHPRIRPEWRAAKVRNPGSVQQTCLHYNSSRYTQESNKPVSYLRNNSLHLTSWKRLWPEQHMALRGAKMAPVLFLSLWLIHTQPHTHTHCLFLEQNRAWQIRWAGLDINFQLWLFSSRCPWNSAEGAWFSDVLHFYGADQTHSKLSGGWGGDERLLLSLDPVTHITDKQCSCELSGHTCLCLKDAVL